MPANNDTFALEGALDLLSQGGVTTQMALLSLAPALALFGIGLLIKSPMGRPTRQWPVSRSLQHIDVFFARHFGPYAAYATELTSGVAHALPYSVIMAWGLDGYIAAEFRILLKPMAALVGMCVLVMYLFKGHLRAIGRKSIQNSGSSPLT